MTLADLSGAPAQSLVVDFIEVAMPVDARAGCSACDSARARLESAVEAVQPLLEEIGVAIKIRDLRVRTMAEAELLRLPASPTIRVGSVEVAPEHRDGETRIWHWRGGEHALPPKGMLVEALLSAAARPGPPREHHRLSPYLNRFLVSGEPKQRLHVHVGVRDIGRSISFYTTLFGAAPSVVKDDYAKWMLDNPRVNFAISAGDHAAKGIEHLGIQVENQEELADVYGRLKAADRPLLEEGATTCCYARSEKSWIADPDGIVWEAFLTNGEATVYGDSPALTALSDNAAQEACCAPQLPAAKIDCCG